MCVICVHNVKESKEERKNTQAVILVHPFNNGLRPVLTLQWVFPLWDVTDLKIQFLPLILYPRSIKSFKPYKLKDTPALQASKGILLKQYSPIDLSKTFYKDDRFVLSFYKTHHVRSLEKSRNSQTLSVYTNPSIELQIWSERDQKRALRLLVW